MSLIIHCSLISVVLHSQTFTKYLHVSHCSYVWGTAALRTEKRIFRGVDILDLGYPNWQTFKERIEPLHMDSWRSICYQYVWTKYTVSLLVNTVSGKAYQSCCASIKCIPVLKFCALFCAPGMISYHLLIRFLLAVILHDYLDCHLLNLSII